MDPTLFSVSVEFDGGDRVELGGGDEFFVTPGDGKQTATLDDERLALIKRLQDASQES